MIAVIVPAHNEQDLIASCLRSIDAAARTPLLQGEQVLVVVVLDACTDGTEAIARRFGVSRVRVDGRNVGVARGAGAALALRAGARWLAFTDADSVVAPDWLAAQIRLDVDAVCGTIGVLDWSPFGARMQRHFEATYTDADGHRHIHGANLGVRAQAYDAVGGFLPLDSSEDVALVRALQRHGASVAWSAAPRVFTSARRSARAPRGFAATLRKVETRGYRDAALQGA